MKTDTLGPTPDYPHRPDHLDFDILSALVIALDSEADDTGPDFEITTVVEKYVDPESLAYMALQRSMRAVGATTKTQVAANMGDIVRLASVYHEAFVMGAKFQQTKMGTEQRAKE